MQTATTPATIINRSEIPSILATLMLVRGMAGPLPSSHALLNDSTRDCDLAGWGKLITRARCWRTRVWGGISARLTIFAWQAMDTLRDLLLAQCDYERAAAVEQEILDCRICRMGGRSSPDARNSRKFRML